MIEQNNAELEWLIAILRTTKPRSLLEVGSRTGECLKAIITGVPTIRLAVSVDVFYPDYDQRSTWATWNVNCEVVPVQGNCQDVEVISTVRERAPFDFVFIDCDHQYESMKHDWNVYGPMCAPTGIVAFHDISPTPHFGFGGWKFWPEIKSSNPTAEKIVDPSVHYFGIGVVFGGNH